MVIHWEFVHSHFVTPLLYFICILPYYIIFDILSRLMNIICLFGAWLSNPHHWTLSFNTSVKNLLKKKIKSSILMHLWHGVYDIFVYSIFFFNRTKIMCHISKFIIKIICKFLLSVSCPSSFHTSLFWVSS